MEFRASRKSWAQVRQRPLQKKLPIFPLPSGRVREYLSTSRKPKEVRVCDLRDLAEGASARDAARMKSARTWNREDKAFLKRLSRLAWRLVEQIDAPTMDYYPRAKVGAKLTSWRTRIAAVAESIDRDIKRIN